MSRPTCYRCFWPKAHCWCDVIRPFATRTRVVLLMHPKEFKQEKAATGRLTHLCVTNSEIIVGTAFDDKERVQELLQDEGSFCTLLYPGNQALNLSTRSNSERTSEHALGATGRSTHAEFCAAATERRLVVFVLDATWALAHKMLKLSPSLQRLPRLMFTPSEPSRYLIKQQPAPECLSTLETVHELLTALHAAALDNYSDPSQLLSLFARMQQFQIDCARDPKRNGYRRSEYRLPVERKPLSGHSRKRRLRMFNAR